MSETTAASPEGAPVVAPQETATTSTTAPADTPQTATTAAANKSTLLDKLALKAEELVKAIGHNEVYGVVLEPRSEGSDIPVPQQVVLQKFLRANANDLAKATEQLEATLKWRKEYQPMKTVEEVFDQSLFDGLGYVIELSDVPGSSNKSDVAVFNVYGAIKDTKKTFGDLDSFIRWRVALMELTLTELHLNDATSPLANYGEGPDPYQAIQIHDYLDTSFLRQPPEVKAASSKTIKLFQQVYPETVSKKYFVNVPIFMQWMFGAMQIFMAKETVAKMKWMSYGTELHKDLGPAVPKAYGGKGADLATSGRSLKHGDVSKKDKAQPAATQAVATETSQPQQPVSADGPATVEPAASTTIAAA